MKNYADLINQLQGPDLPLYAEAIEAIEELLARQVVIRDTGGDDYYTGGMVGIDAVVTACADAGVACIYKEIDGNLVRSYESYDAAGKSRGKMKVEFR